jgi:hypothetical protein
MEDRDEWASIYARVEEEVLRLFRGEHVDNFTLTITRSDGLWTVSFIDLDEPSAQWRGTGADFAQAWQKAESPLIGDRPS